MGKKSFPPTPSSPTLRVRVSVSEREAKATSPSSLRPRVPASPHAHLDLRVNSLRCFDPLTIDP